MASDAALSPGWSARSPPGLMRCPGPAGHAPCAPTGGLPRRLCRQPLLSPVQSPANRFSEARRKSRRPRPPSREGLAVLAGCPGCGHRNGTPRTAPRVAPAVCAIPGRPVSPPGLGGSWMPRHRLPGAERPPRFSLDHRGTITSQANPDASHACWSRGDRPTASAWKRAGRQARSALCSSSQPRLCPSGPLLGGHLRGSPVGGQDPRSFPETLVFRACTEASMISAARETARLVGSGRLEKDRSCDGDGIPLWLRSLRHEGRRHAGYSSGAVLISSQYSLQQSMCRACPCGVKDGRIQRCWAGQDLGAINLVSIELDTCAVPPLVSQGPCAQPPGAPG